MRDLWDGFNSRLSRTHLKTFTRANWMRRCAVLRGRTGLTVRYVESMPELMAHAVALRQFSMWVVSSPAQSATDFPKGSR